MPSFLPQDSVDVPATASLPSSLPRASESLAESKDRNPSSPATMPAIGATLAEPKKAEVDQLFNHTVSHLGTLVTSTVSRLRSATSWESFVAQERGGSHFQPGLQNLDHPAGTCLASSHERGVPVKFDDAPWTQDRKDEVASRGCHYSATQHASFIAEEMMEFARDGHWVILPYEEVRTFEEVRLSPAQIKVERDRKPRFIADHSFWGLNDRTLPLAFKDSMQFGGALCRLLYAIRHANPAYGTVRMMKLDLKDGFYKVHLRPKDALALSVLLPSYEGLPPLVAVPLALTMGWINSPPTFTSMSETICDLANQRLYKRHERPHRQEGLASAQDDPECVPSVSDAPTLEPSVSDACPPLGPDAQQ